MNDVTNYLEEQMNKHFEAGDKEKGAIYKEAFISSYRLHTIDATISHINKRLDAQEKLINEHASRIKAVSNKVEKYVEEIMEPVTIEDKLNRLIDSIAEDGMTSWAMDEFRSIAQEIIDLNK